MLQLGGIYANFYQELINRRGNSDTLGTISSYVNCFECSVETPEWRRQFRLWLRSLFNSSSVAISILQLSSVAISTVRLSGIAISVIVLSSVATFICLQCCHFCFQTVQCCHFHYLAVQCCRFYFPTVQCCDFDLFPVLPL